MQSAAIFNKAQQRAITWPLPGKNKHHLEVIAGPGTGKTLTLTARLLYLLKEAKISPEQILALTFTRKAAGEIRERLLKEGIQFKNIATFHALGYQILMDAGQEVKLVSERQQQRILTDLRSSLGLTKNYSRKDLELLISKTKNSVVADTQGILTAYNNKLHQTGLQDYEDLIIDATRLYHENKQLQRYTYILIDEFQDTSRIQLELIAALSAGQIFAVGDPRQAIYGFRGSDPESFNNLRTAFPGQEFTTIELTENYRAAPELVAAANLIFPEFQPLQARVQHAGAWHLVTTLNPYTEADYIIADITTRLGGTYLEDSGDTPAVSTGTKDAGFRDFAVLYRSHYQKRILEQKLADLGLPFQVVGEGNPFTNLQVRLVITVLNYLLSKETMALKELLFTPALKLSTRTLDNLEALMEINPDTLAQEKYFHDPLLRSLADKLAALQEFKDLPLTELITKITTEFNITQDTAFQEFRNLALNFPGDTNTFLEYLQRLSEQEFYDPAAEKLTLLTMHAAKGLEFNYVYILDFNLSKTTANPEELRLFYVALTRAKKILQLIQTTAVSEQPAQIYEVIKTSPHQILADPKLAQILKKKIKLKEKRAQARLF
jgi:superfamily I DNA/RNA helicase